MRQASKFWRCKTRLGNQLSSYAAVRYFQEKYVISLFCFYLYLPIAGAGKYTSSKGNPFPQSELSFFSQMNGVTDLPLFFSADMGWPPSWTLSKWESSSQFSTAACLRFEKYSLRAVIFKIMTQLMCSQKVKSLNMQTCCQGRRWKSVMAFKVRVNLFEFPCFLLFF